MLHLIYILAFTILAFLAVGNLIRSLMTLGVESQRAYSSPWNSPGGPNSGRSYAGTTPHPELLDESGNMVKEPYLVMRSITMEDARDQLDALYEASPGSASSSQSDEAHDEA